MASAGVHVERQDSLTKDQVDDLEEIFKEIDVDESGYISVSELGDALSTVGIKLPSYVIRDFIAKSDTKIKDEKLDFEEFIGFYVQFRDRYDLGGKFRNLIATRNGLHNYGGMSATSTEGTTHSVRKEEQVAFSKWINRNLSSDPDCGNYLPLNPDSRDLYIKCYDGILLCKLINLSQPGTIDERTINKGKLNIYQIHENLTLAVNSAQSIGCYVVNIGPDDLQAGKPHLVLGLLWQIIRIGLLSDINAYEHPGLLLLHGENEEIGDFMKLSPEDMLIRWVNHHLARSNCRRQISNLTSDISDSVVYIHLIHQISPRDAGVTTAAESEPDLHKRAERMLQEADKINCRSFLSPDVVVQGNYKLNLVFVANLFKSHPGLDSDNSATSFDDFDQSDIQEETREEKMYRNWMNSMGVNPAVYHLYSDLTDGLVIFQLYDVIRPGAVDWSHVIKDFHHKRMMMEKIENCNYAVKLGKASRFSLVGIGGKDIYDGNATLTLALVWQVMRAYTLSILSKLAAHDGRIVAEKEIVEWANEKLKSSEKTSKISGFTDPSIANSKAIIDLVDACKPGCVNYGLVKAGGTEQERLDNAKYAISMARKTGARVYALPDDIVEVKAKMVMTIFACIMIKDLQQQTLKKSAFKKN